MRLHSQQLPSLAPSAPTAAPAAPPTPSPFAPLDASTIGRYGFLPNPLKPLSEFLEPAAPSTRALVESRAAATASHTAAPAAPASRPASPHTRPHRHRVVIIGGGFAGMYAARQLRGAELDITLVDRRNFHLFQPLLYQVATGGLSPGEIASPLRAVVSAQKNVRTLLAEMADLDADAREVLLTGGDRLPYDTLIVATGASHHYFGNPQWADNAPGLKTIEDALEIRSKIFAAFEAAELESDPARRAAQLTFVVVGGGPTGVELAGALGELANKTLRDDFRRIDPREARILLVEGSPRVLGTYSPTSSERAVRQLEALGVRVRTGSQVVDITEDGVRLKDAARNVEEYIPAKTVLWAAGVKASPVGAMLARRCGATLDKAGRVNVGAGLHLETHPEIFVLGDLARHEPAPGAAPVPGVAPAAMQMGSHAAAAIRARLAGKTPAPFRYVDKGSLAVIGRNAAVAEMQGFKFAGFPAWFLWIFIHIFYLIEFENKFLVMFQWAYEYVTRNRGARLITGEAWLGSAEARNASLPGTPPPRPATKSGAKPAANVA